MSGTLLTLARRLENLAQDIGPTANELKKQAASEMLKHLVNSTPVDTSQALSNWQVGVGQPVPDNPELKPFVAGKAGSTASASRAAAIEAGLAQIAAVQPGQPIYLSNVVPYIKRLNNGWSKQHPGGFVEAAILIGRRFVLNVKLVRLRK